MSSVEDQVRAALQEIAEDARSAPLLQRLEATRNEPQKSFTRPRLLVGVVAAAVVVGLVSVGIVRLEQRQDVQPVQQPPKILRLSEDDTLSPGRALMAVSLAADSENDDTPAYVLTGGDGTAVLLSGGIPPEGSWTQQLSADGTRFVRQSWVHLSPTLEVIDLRTGEVEQLDVEVGYCPQLSPDNAAIASLSADERSLVVIDRRSGKETRLSSVDFECGYNTLGWSPDGDRLAIRTQAGSEVVDRSGMALAEIPGRTITNGSMSWSPDGEDLLMYESASGIFAVVPVDGGSAVELTAPAPVAKPMGWTGDRVVWLVGEPGEQRLVTTDAEGGDVQPWVRLDLGGRVVDNSTWSRALTGAAVD